MKKISFEDIGEVVATFAVEDGVKDGQVVLSASASGMESTEGTAFTLPDGTVLHRTSD